MAPPSQREAGPVCLRSYEIQNTTVPNDSTILFTMLNHAVWKNALPAPCPGLRAETEGFAYEPTDPGTDEICSNLLTIRLRTTGVTCMLGPFTQVTLQPAKP